MSKEDEFERRLAALEQAVADLQRRLAGAPDPQDWLYQVAGSVRDAEGFEEVLKYGREFRHSDRPQDEASEPS
jgi:hypothetical protein